MGYIPFADAGVIVIVFTTIIKFVLLPLSIKASKSQIEMKSVEKDLQIIKDTYKDNKEELSKKTIEYYKEKGINPFAGILILIIQLPIIIGLYQVFLKSGLPEVKTAWLYSFVAIPTSINMMFLNLINISQKSILLAIIAGLTTYFQISLANTAQTQPSGSGMQQDIAKAMAVQMKYFFPIVVTFISYSISGALSLYWITSNVFSIVQEMYIKKKYHQAPPVVI
ncbi:MAG: YidC/Oxa1 family rane protein insertase [Patescibacteria group bacterium]|nr:YidC/Oxa1 family rane protein insertase [Patescibacteria group bacterium]